MELTVYIQPCLGFACYAKPPGNPLYITVCRQRKLYSKKIPKLSARTHISKMPSKSQPPPEEVQTHSGPDDSAATSAPGACLLQMSALKAPLATGLALE
jgi:hypothetical protein